MNIKLSRRTGILLSVGLLCLVSALVLSADLNFAGTWKGEYSAAAPAPRGADAGGDAPAAPAGRSGGRGGAGGSSAPQKITLRVKVNKEKATGNFTMGSSAPEDIREGKIDGDKLTFKTGLAPAPTYDYSAVMAGEDLSVTRSAEGGRGGRPQTFTLTHNK